MREKIARILDVVWKCISFLSHVAGRLSLAWAFCVLHLMGEESIRRPWWLVVWIVMPVFVAYVGWVEKGYVEDEKQKIIDDIKKEHQEELAKEHDSKWRLYEEKWRLYEENLKLKNKIDDLTNQLNNR